MRAKVLTINVEGNGYYLVFENEICEIIVSTSVLASCGFWDIPVIVKTRNGNPVAVLRSLDDDSHVKTRIAQYEALHNGKGITIAKTIVLSKIRKYGLKELNLTFYKSKIEGLNSNSLKEKALTY